MILRNNVVKAIIFYGQIKRRLSMLTLARMLGVSILAIEEEVRQLLDTGMIEMRDGEVGMTGQDYRFSVVAREKAFKRLRTAVWIAGFNPFIKGIAGANSLGLDSVKVTSDVDVVVIARVGRVYGARLLFALPLLLFKLRPHQTENFPLCASFFIDEARSLADTPLTKDIYFAHWASSLVVHGDAEGVLKSLQPFMAEYSLTLPVRTADIPMSFFQTCVRGVLKSMFDYDVVERLLMKFQQWYMPTVLKTGGSGITIGHDIFKAHMDDKRATLQENFEKLCLERGL